MNRDRLRRGAIRAAAVASLGIGLLLVGGGVAQAQGVSSSATVGSVVVADATDVPVATPMTIEWT